MAGRKPIPEGYHTLGEAADKIGKSQAWLHQLIRKGHFKAETISFGTLNYFIFSDDDISLLKKVAAWKDGQRNELKAIKEYLTKNNLDPNSWENYAKAISAVKIRYDSLPLDERLGDNPALITFHKYLDLLIKDCKTLYRWGNSVKVSMEEDEKEKTVTINLRFSD